MSERVPATVALATLLLRTRQLDDGHWVAEIRALLGSWTVVHASKKRKKARGRALEQFARRRVSCLDNGVVYSPRQPKGDPRQ